MVSVGGRVSNNTPMHIGICDVIFKVYSCVEVVSITAKKLYMV
jgi:hypothetical protein